MAPADAALVATMDGAHLSPADVDALTTAAARTRYLPLRDARRAAKARVEGHVRGDPNPEVLAVLWQAYEASAATAHRLLLRVQGETHAPGTCTVCDGAG